MMLDELRIREYEPGDDDAALELERVSAQRTGGLHLAFRRPTFRRRTETFPSGRILTAWRGDRLAGVIASGVKDVALRGRPARAGFLFDLRVHPRDRGQGVARRLADEALLWLAPRVDLAYAYGANTNGATRHLAEVFGFGVEGAFRTLPVPTHRDLAPRHGAGRCAPEELADLRRRLCPASDFEPAAVRTGEPGYVASWVLRAGRGIAGCSAWTHEDVLAEVVVQMPAWLRAVGGLLRRLPSRRPFPVPRLGAPLRSWTCFDLFATESALAVSLLRTVARQAAAQGVDWCHVLCGAADPWARALRRDLWPIPVPRVEYRLLARRSDGGPLGLRTFRPDVRDL
jgi:ribosomal protein S18 acetylase RimI-like enzyme